MPIQKLEIEDFLRKSKGFPILDVRSPKEYRHAHMQGAFLLPVFDDEQRAVIGTAYKQEGRESAVNKGLEYFSSTMKNIQPQALKIFSKMNTDEPPTFFVHCWRGGMRSGAIAWLLSLYGYKVYVLDGGYKSFRRWVLSRFELNYNLKLLGGFTGSGKTEVLHELKRQGDSVIDLEGLANHKGSAFGSLGMPPQPSQEMFENRLAVELAENLERGKSIWLEDESRHIGKIFIPAHFWEQMRESPLFFLDIPADKRLNYIVKGYGSFDKELLENAVLKIKKRLGGQNCTLATNYIEEGNVKGAFEILLGYYDKLYNHSLKIHQESGMELHKINCEDVDIKNVFQFVDLL